MALLFILLLAPVAVKGFQPPYARRVAGWGAVLGVVWLLGLVGI
jgi:hypothetical protein